MKLHIHCTNYSQTAEFFQLEVHSPLLQYRPQQNVIPTQCYNNLQIQPVLEEKRRDSTLKHWSAPNNELLRFCEVNSRVWFSLSLSKCTWPWGYRSSWFWRLEVLSQHAFLASIYLSKIMPCGDRMQTQLRSSGSHVCVPSSSEAGLQFDIFETFHRFALGPKAVWHQTKLSTDGEIPVWERRCRKALMEK